MYIITEKDEGLSVTVNSETHEISEILLGPPGWIQFDRNPDRNLRTCASPGDNMSWPQFTEALTALASRKEIRVQDVGERILWSLESVVEIYSRSRGQWCLGSVTKVDKDSEGEWLVVKYRVEDGNWMTKHMRRFDEDIRPAPNISAELQNPECLRGYWIVTSPNVGLAPQRLHLDPSAPSYTFYNSTSKCPPDNLMPPDSDGNPGPMQFCGRHLAEMKPDIVTWSLPDSQCIWVRDKSPIADIFSLPIWPFDGHKPSLTTGSFGSFVVQHPIRISLKCP